MSTSPALSNATQNDADGHDTPVRLLLPSTPEAVQAEAPPVGLVEATTFPESPTATHSDADRHDTPADWWAR